MRTKLLIAVAIAGAALWASAPTAMAKGGGLYPVEDRYEVGETATLIGYTVPSDEGPFAGYLRVDPAAAEADSPDSAWTFVHPSDVPLGPTVVEVLPDAQESWSSVRVSLIFVVPQVKPGIYEVVVCDDPCTTGPGYITGGEVAIGVDPPARFVRHWPMSEPAIADLDPDALVYSPKVLTPLTAADLRGDIVPARPAPTTTRSDRGAELALVGIAMIAVGLVVLARRFGPARKRVTRASATSPQLSPDLPSGPPKRIRL